VSVIDVSLDRVNGTAIQLFAGRTDEPRTAVVADVLLNDALPARVREERDTLALAAGGVVLGHERLRHERPDLDRLLADVSLDRAALERAVRAILGAVGPDHETERIRALRLELRACEEVLRARERGVAPRLSARLRRHLPPRFEGLCADAVGTGVAVDDLATSLDRRYEDALSLLFGPSLYQQTAPDRLPETELRATLFGPSMGPGLELPGRERDRDDGRGG
jgi:hypothetical protein